MSKTITNKQDLINSLQLTLVDAIQRRNIALALKVSSLLKALGCGSEYGQTIRG